MQLAKNNLIPSIQYPREDILTWDWQIFDRLSIIHILGLMPVLLVQSN